MSWRHPGILLTALSIAAGTMADRPAPPTSLGVGGYRILAADLHSHSSWSNGALTPWGLVLEARHRGLDVIAITGHNQVFDSRVGRWFGRITGGPTVLTGQEIQTRSAHVIALGIEETVDWRQPVADQIDAVHRQGGIAIAAHPDRDFWPGFDAAAMSRLDGSEVCHPAVFVRGSDQQEMEQFAARAPLTAIGSSDFHGWGRLGSCRTYVFASDNTPQAILEALRRHHTVVYGPGDRVYGDPELIEWAARYPRLREAALEPPDVGWLDWISRISAVAGLLTLLGLEAPVSGRSD